MRAAEGISAPKHGIHILKEVTPTTADSQIHLVSCQGFFSFNSNIWLPIWNLAEFLRSFSHSAEMKGKHQNREAGRLW
jgi:hypothetical protein